MLSEELIIGLGLGAAIDYVAVPVARWMWSRLRGEGLDQLVERSVTAAYNALEARLRQRFPDKQIRIDREAIKETLTKSIEQAASKLGRTASRTALAKVWAERDVVMIEDHPLDDREYQDVIQEFVDLIRSEVRQMVAGNEAAFRTTVLEYSEQSIVSLDQVVSQIDLLVDGHFQVMDELRRIAAQNRQVIANTRVGPSKFLDPNAFEAQIQRRDRLPTALPFVGRAAELTDALEAITALPVLVVSGLPGVGKTRFAIELARHLATQPDFLTHEIKCVRDVPGDVDAAIGREFETDKPYIVLIDDAHLFGQIDAIIDLVNHPGWHQANRIILTVRSYATQSVEQELRRARTGLGIVELGTLSNDDALVLIGYMGVEPEAIMSALGEKRLTTRDIVVAAALIQSGKDLASVDPLTLYGAYYEQILGEIKGLLDKRPVAHKLIAIFAFLRATRVDESQLRLMVAGLGEPVRPEDVKEIIAELRRAELLDATSDGLLIRISNDSLGEYIAYREFFDPRRASLEFMTDMWMPYGQRYPTAIADVLIALTDRRYPGARLVGAINTLVTTLCEDLRIDPALDDHLLTSLRVLRVLATTQPDRIGNATRDYMVRLTHHLNQVHQAGAPLPAPVTGSVFTWTGLFVPGYDYVQAALTLAIELCDYLPTGPELEALISQISVWGLSGHAQYEEARTRFGELFAYVAVRDKVQQQSLDLQCAEAALRAVRQAHVTLDEKRQVLIEEWASQLWSHRIRNSRDGRQRVERIPGRDTVTIDETPALRQVRNWALQVLFDAYAQCAADMSRQVAVLAKIKSGFLGIDGPVDTHVSNKVAQADAASILGMIPDRLADCPLALRFAWDHLLHILERVLQDGRAGSISQTLTSPQLTWLWQFADVLSDAEWSAAGLPENVQDRVGWAGAQFVTPQRLANSDQFIHHGLELQAACEALIGSYTTPRMDLFPLFELGRDQPDIAIGLIQRLRGRAWPEAHWLFSLLQGLRYGRPDAFEQFGRDARQAANIGELVVFARLLAYPQDVAQFDQFTFLEDLVTLNQADLDDVLAVVLWNYTHLQSERVGAALLTLAARANRERLRVILHGFNDPARWATDQGPRGALLPPTVARDIVNLANRPEHLPLEAERGVELILALPSVVRGDVVWIKGFLEARFQAIQALQQPTRAWYALNFRQDLFRPVPAAKHAELLDFILDQIRLHQSTDPGYWREMALSLIRGNAARATNDISILGAESVQVLKAWLARPWAHAEVALKVLDAVDDLTVPWGILLDTLCATHPEHLFPRQLIPMWMGMREPTTYHRLKRVRREIDEALSIVTTLGAKALLIATVGEVDKMIRDEERDQSTQAEYERWLEEAKETLR